MSKAKLAYAIWPWGLKTKEQMISALQDIKAIGFNYFESVAAAVDLTAELDCSRFGNKENAAMNMKYLQAHGFK